MNAQAIKPTRLRCLPVTALNQIARQDPRLGFKLYEAMARELAATRDLLLTTGQRSATERVVSFLLAFSRRNERNGQDPCSVRPADDAGRHRRLPGPHHRDREPHLHQARVMGLIELPQSSTVHIKDLEQLQGLAGGEEEF